MWALKSKHAFVIMFAALSIALSNSMTGPVMAESAWRSGHPPKVLSAQFDSQRRLVVVFNAQDGMAFGGFLLIDNDPVNATPASVNPTYGPIMPCNNKGTCKGSWRLPTFAGNGPYTYTTESLDERIFPSGIYYLQVDSMNEDPFPSTRQEEFSEIATINLKTSVSPPVVPLLLSLKLPINNGTSLCIAWRDHLLLGNLVVQALNSYNTRLNAALAKIPTPSSNVEAIYQRALKQTSDIKKSLARDLERANSACGAAPSVVAKNGEFVPIPIPTSNGTSACNKSRSHISYLNQELAKIVNNLRTTTRSQTTRIKQLEVRFSQLSADLKKSWPGLFQACNPF